MPNFCCLANSLIFNQMFFLETNLAALEGVLLATFANGNGFCQKTQFFKACDLTLSLQVDGMAKISF